MTITGVLALAGDGIALPLPANATRQTGATVRR
jgi:hypothetical protein